MVDQRNDDNVLLLLLAMMLAGDVDEPFASDLMYRLSRSGRLREQLGPEFDYLIERGIRRGWRSRRREEFSELVEGLRAGFEQQTKALKALTKALASAKAPANEQSLAETAGDLYDTIWLLSVGGSLADAHVRRTVPVRIYFSEGLSSAERKSVMSALQNLLAPDGFELAYSLPDEEGSWWKRFLFRSKELLTNDEVTKRLQKAERAVEAKYLDKPQAEANNLQAGAAASLIGALAGTEKACIQVGSLLVVKATDTDGKSAVIARTLTQDELRELEENQSILREPQKILEFLESAGPKRIL